MDASKKAQTTTMTLATDCIKFFALFSHIFFSDKKRRTCLDFFTR
jgi:hypothetical protein